MTPSDLRRIALTLPDVEESSHMGSPDFRVGGHIFATLASQAQGYGNLMLTPETQAAFLADSPEVFLPIKDGWGRMGMTHIRLAEATEDILTGALRTAYNLRIQKNAKPSTNKSKTPVPTPAATTTHPRVKYPRKSLPAR
jgi:hypothetical protein